MGDGKQATEFDIKPKNCIRTNEGKIYLVDIDERFGTIIRILPSLSGTDAWHHEKGFVGNTRAAQAYAWGKETGYKGHFQVNMNELKI